MGSVRHYLKGPGGELRHVVLDGGEERSAAHGSPDGRHAPRASNTTYKFHHATDEAGNVAEQYDYEGFRFKFANSAVVWELVVT